MLLIAVAVILVILSVITILNALTFPRLRTTGQLPWLPKVSILIPARNEAAIIAQTVRRLLAQTYANFELIVLDDSSTDQTAEITRAAGEHDPRLCVWKGDPLPPGWTGKNWACHQLSQRAEGEILVFTDADVEWTPTALEAIVRQQTVDQVDLLAVWPTQRTESWTERLVVPLMSYAIMAYLPVLLVNHTRWTRFAAANGQCMVFRRSAYDKVGGHLAVRDDIVEDVALARRIKAYTLRLYMADGNELVACRMYLDWSSVRDGFAKNILAGHMNSVPFLGVSAVFHWAIFILPFLWLLGGSTWAVLLIMMAIGVRALSAAVTRQRVADALLMPLSVVLMTIIALRSVWWKWRYGGPQWKGRSVGLNQESSHA